MYIHMCVYIYMYKDTHTHTHKKTDIHITHKHRVLLQKPSTQVFKRIYIYIYIYIYKRRYTHHLRTQGFFATVIDLSILSKLNRFFLQM